MTCQLAYINSIEEHSLSRTQRASSQAFRVRFQYKRLPLSFRASVAADASLIIALRRIGIAYHDSIVGPLGVVFAKPHEARSREYGITTARVYEDCVLVRQSLRHLDHVARPFYIDAIALVVGIRRSLPEPDCGRTVVYHRRRAACCRERSKKASFNRCARSDICLDKGDGLVVE